MKKRLLALILSALLLINVVACNIVSAPENDDGMLEDNDTSESNFEETDEKTTESETNAETKAARNHPEFVNGDSANSDVTYIFNQNNDFSLHIAGWDETHLFTSLADEDIAAAKYYASAIGVNNERAFLVLNRYYENKITIVSFEKGSPSEIVVNFNVDENVYRISGNFINETTGYLFTFEEESTGDSKVSNLYKTEDGGKTWDSIHVQNVPSISRREYIMFARMVSEDVGLISGNVWGYDYNFCERTLLTTDGGLNWCHVNIPEMPQDDDLPWATVTNFTQVEDTYILTIRYGTSVNNYDYAKYKLSDTNTWIRIN